MHIQNCLKYEQCALVLHVIHLLYITELSENMGPVQLRSPNECEGSMTSSNTLQINLALTGSMFYKSLCVRFALV